MVRLGDAGLDRPERTCQGLGIGAPRGKEQQAQGVLAGELPAGATAAGGQILQIDPQNPTRVGLLMDVADMDVVMKAMQTPGAAAAMEYDGVIPETLVILVEA